jgi:hypothetical protein
MTVADQTAVSYTYDTAMASTSKLSRTSCGRPKAPPRGPIDVEVAAGETLFAQVGCAVCHTPASTTARPGTRFNAGALTVAEALGNKIVRPYR